MSNPRIEEVDDASDPEEMDLDAFDFARPGQTSLQDAQAAPRAQQQQRQQQPQQPTPDMMQQMQQMLGGAGGAGGAGGPGGITPEMMQKMMGGAGGAGGMPQMDHKERMRLEREQQEKCKAYQCIYPIYFDASRSREEGRRVKKEDAVRNPLARDIIDALQHISGQVGVALQIVFEPSKCHPKDWANPGRAKVLVKKDGKPVTAKIANKHELYRMISAYLKSNPTTDQSPFKLRVPGLPLPKDNKYPQPAVPRGFKMGNILPLHSPALSGGGVSDNMMADMMKELQGGGGAGGMPGMPPGLAGGAAGGGGGAPAGKKGKKK